MNNFWNVKSWFHLWFKLELTESNVSRLQHVARLLGVSSVEKLCKKFVKSGLNITNCFSRFSLADSFLGWSDTASMIQKFIEFNFSDILKNNIEEFCSKLNEVQLKRILSSCNLHVKSEDEVVEAERLTEFHGKQHQTTPHSPTLQLNSGLHWVQLMILTCSCPSVDYNVRVDVLKTLH